MVVYDATVKRVQEYRDASGAMLLVGTPLVTLSLVDLVLFLPGEYGLFGWWSYAYGFLGPVPGFIGAILVALGVRAGTVARRRKETD